MSSSWLEAATLPFKPTPPRVAPPNHPKTAALMRANQQKAQKEQKEPQQASSSFLGVLPSAPARVAPPGVANFNKPPATPTLAARRGQPSCALSVPSAPARGLRSISQEFLPGDYDLRLLARKFWSFEAHKAEIFNFLVVPIVRAEKPKNDRI